MSNIGFESIDSVNFVIDQIKSSNGPVKDGENIENHGGKPQEWEYPELTEDDGRLEDDHYDIPDIKYGSTEYASICKPYMDKASLWIQSLLDNIKKTELWSLADSEAIKSKDLF